MAGAFLVAATVLFLLDSFVGKGTLLTMSVPIGAGVAAAALPGGAMLSRGMWLFIGALVGTLGFVLGASLFPDTAVGLWLGAVVPTLILALLTMWTKRPSNFLAALLGSGAMAGVYAQVFNFDPQAINVSAPIALGQTVLPLGLGYLLAVLAIQFLGAPDEPPAGPAPAPAPAPSSSEVSA
jgi:hypothetical protein